MTAGAKHRVSWATSGQAKQACALDAIRWLYPRGIHPTEVELAYWFRYGEHAVFWYQWQRDPVDRDLVLHVCVEPEWRGLIYPRRWLDAVGILGEILGADRLVFPGGVGDLPIEDYLRRLGWKDYSEGLALELSPRSEDGEASEAEEAQEGHTRPREGSRRSRSKTSRKRKNTHRHGKNHQGRKHRKAAARKAKTRGR